MSDTAEFNAAVQVSSSYIKALCCIVKNGTIRGLLTNIHLISISLL